jgi:hypothetical protein
MSWLDVVVVPGRRWPADCCECGMPAKLTIGACVLAMGGAQAQNAASPKFEVAAIGRCDGPGFGGAAGRGRSLLEGSNPGSKRRPRVRRGWR